MPWDTLMVNLCQTISFFNLLYWNSKKFYYFYYVVANWFVLIIIQIFSSKQAVSPEKSLICLFEGNTEFADIALIILAASASDLSCKK